MEDKSWERVEQWWADTFGVPVSMLWEKGVTIGFHAGLADYPGIVVAGRKKAAHVSLPDWVDQRLADKIGKHSVDELLDRRFWLGWLSSSDAQRASVETFGPLRSGYRVSPLMVHAYTDHQHETPNKVEQIAFDDVAHWRDLVSSKKWEASGFADQVTHVFAVRAGKDVAAAANLSRFLGGSSNVGVLTHPKYRGKGYAAPVTRAATAYAVRNEGMARFRYDADHARSIAVGRSLRFEEYARQLVILPR